MLFVFVGVKMGLCADDGIVCIYLNVDVEIMVNPGEENPLEARLHGVEYA